MRPISLLRFLTFADSMFSSSRHGSRRISEKYAPVGKIGEGTYGLVYKARTVQPPAEGNSGESFVAVKKFKSFKSGDGISPTAIREIKLLRELKNRYIVDLVDVMLDEQDKSLYLVFDYAEHDLLEMIRWHHARNVRIRNTISSTRHSFCLRCANGVANFFLMMSCAVATNAHANCQVIAMADSSRYELPSQELDYSPRFEAVQHPCDRAGQAATRARLCEDSRLWSCSLISGSSSTAGRSRCSGCNNLVPCPRASVGGKALHESNRFMGDRVHFRRAHYVETTLPRRREGT